MHSGNPFDRLNFDNHFLFHDEICFKSNIDHNPVINKWNLHLSCHPKPPRSQHISQ